MKTLRSLSLFCLILAVFALLLPAARASKATARVGQQATLLVTADGTAPFDYAWALAGLAVPGATANPLVLANLQLANGGDWTVTVSNSAGSATSDKASLTVFDAPIFTLQPATQTVAAGSAAIFTAAASNQVSTTAETVTLMFQWQKNGAPIAGATAAAYTIAAVAAADVGSYTCLATTTVGTAPAAVTASTTSSTAALSLQVIRPTIRGPVSISIQ